MKLQGMKIETYDNGYVVEGHERSGEILAYAHQHIRMCFNTIEEVLKFIESHMISPTDLAEKRETQMTTLRKRLEQEKGQAALTPAAYGLGAAGGRVY